LALLVVVYGIAMLIQCSVQNIVVIIKPQYYHFPVLGLIADRQEISIFPDYVAE
jgi:hypothetical protein